MPVVAEEVIPCENDQHIFAPNAPSTELGHDGYCALCGAELTGEHIPGWVDNGDGTHSAGCAICGYIAEGTVPVSHSEDHSETVDATCTADGYSTVYCICGASVTQTIPALGHDVGDGVVTTEPTCTSDGAMTYTCRRCGESTTQTIPALGHDVDDGVVTIEPTATSDGVMTYTCRRCGETATQTLPATGAPEQPAVCDHSWGEWTDDGDTHVRICANCGAEERDGHSYEGGMTSGNATVYTCAFCGKQRTEVASVNGSLPCDHVYGEWTYDENGHHRTCEKCSGVESTDHVPGESGACTICGYDQETACDHVWSAWTSDENGHHRTCEKCSKSESADHSYDKGTLTKSATETEAGEILYTCTVCDYKKRDVIPVVVHHLPDSWSDVAEDDENHWKHCTDDGCDYSVSEAHAYGEGVETKPATATENGVMTYTCTVCGHVRNVDIPALSHAWGEWTAVEGDAVNHYKYCTDEGCALFYGEPHTWRETITAPTCAKEGKLVRTCTVCGYEVETVLKKTDHTWGEWKTDSSQHTRECAVCGEKESAAHTFGDYAFDADKDPDHHYAVCTACGLTVSGEHTWNEGAVVTAATPYTTGLKQYSCTAEGCTATKFETLSRIDPALTDRYLYFPVKLTCSGSHSAATADLAVPTLDFGEIYLGSDGYYRVQRTMTVSQSWQDYFVDLAGWKGSHRLSTPADGKLTMTAVLTPENVWQTETLQLTFEDVADHFTVKFKSGDRVVETVIVKAGEKLGKLPAVDDDEFLGWYYKNGTKATENDVVSSNLTLYARYSYDVPKTGNNDHQLMLVLLGVSGAMLLVMIFCAVQMIRLSKKPRR